MLQNKFEMPLDLEIKPSKIFYSYLIVILLFSLVSLLILNSLPVSTKMLLFFLLLFIAVFIFKKQKINQATYLFLNKNDEWALQINNKQRVEVELTGECIVTYFLIWLNFSVCNSFGRKKVYHLLLLPDSVDKHSLRQLRVRLRFLKNRTEEENKEDTVIARMN